MTTTNEKAAGVGAPTARKDRTSSYDHDHDLILPATTGIVTLALLIAGWTAYEYGRLLPALALLALAAGIQAGMGRLDRMEPAHDPSPTRMGTTTGRPARAVGPHLLDRRRHPARPRGNAIRTTVTEGIE